MSDHAWWTPARRRLYGRPMPNGITCQSCGHDVCQCPPRAATIGEHVDAVLAAKDAEIERLRRELEWKAEVVELPDKHPLRLRAEKAERERDDLRALLRECRDFICAQVDYDAAPSVVQAQPTYGDMLARIDACLENQA